MKYKIGTMVVLSAAGRKRQHNPMRVFTGFGIVMDYRKCKAFPYEMMWFSKTHDPKEFSAKEYEIKKVKTPKSNKNKNNS
jgi:hypothetical protein